MPKAVVPEKAFADALAWSYVGSSAITSSSMMGHCMPSMPEPRLQRSCQGAAFAWASACRPAEPQVAQATAGTQGGASLIQRKAFLAPCA
eukprot:10192002-Heterocapsa_arctica.AAC.1